MKKDRLLTFIEFLLDNIFDISTIFVAAYLIIRNELQPFGTEDVPSLITWLLAVLGLLAVSGVWERSRRIKKIETDLSKLNDTITKRFEGKTKPSDFFLDGNTLSEDFFATANSILIIGITLNRTTRRFMQILSHKLASGCHIRLALIDPQSSAVMEIMAKRSMGETTPDFWRSKIANVEGVISVIRNTPNSKGKFEIGYLPYIPSFGFFMIDPDEPHGHAFVEIYHQRTAEENPTFTINAQDDPVWWKFFKNQADIMWNDCRKVD